MKKYYSICIITSIILGLLMFFIVRANEKTIYIPYEETIYGSYLKEAPLDSPLNHDAKDVIAYSLYKTYYLDSFKVETTGKTITSMMNITQNVNGLRIIKDDKAYIYTESDGLIDLRYERYYYNSNRMIKNDLVKKEISYYDYAGIMQQYGWLPYYANGYVLSNDTYLNELMLEEDGDNYTIYVELDPSSDKAPFWYRREIITNSGSSIEPIFNFIHIKFTIDNEYRILKQEIEEEYKIRVFFETIATTKVVDIFSYDNIDFPSEVNEFFVLNE